MCVSTYTHTETQDASQLTFTSNGRVAVKATGAYDAWVLEHRAEGRGWIKCSIRASCSFLIPLVS